MSTKVNHIEKTEILKIDKPFYLESGALLPELEISFTTAGKLNHTKSNVVWVCHALTANANPQEWWPGLIGHNCVINPDEHFIVCANILGSCYGTTGPLSNQKETSSSYFSNFPIVTVRDMVNAHILLANYLGIENIQLIIGGSLGGQQALEWSILESERIKNLVLIATNANHSPYGIAINEAQRMAIFADQTYHENKIDGGIEGLKAARAIALISYRTYKAYNSTQAETDQNKTDLYNASSYQQYQGQKLANRFNAYSYICLSKAMDSHNVARNRESANKVLSTINAKTICIGISSDILFPINEQKYLQQHIPNSQFYEIDSEYGHDGFLIEAKKITEIIKNKF